LSSRFRLAVSSVAILIGAALLVLPAPAGAAPRHQRHHNHRHHDKPRVFWKLPGRASEGQAIPFTWKVKGRIGGKYRLIAQRPVGTARVWRTMLRLRTRQGSAELPGQKLGKYRFRLALLEGRRVLAKQVVGIGVFGQVPFSTLFRGHYGHSGVYAAPSVSFPYIEETKPGQFDRPVTVFSVKDNRCTVVHIDFITGEEQWVLEVHEGYRPATGIITVVQQSRDPVSDSAPFNSPNAVDAELVPGQTWSVLAAYENGEPPHIYLNGYAVCNSTEPFFS